MRNRGLTLLEALVIVVVIAFLAAIFIPCHGGIRNTKKASCLFNLHQLYTVGTIYARSHKGEWSSATGDDLWLSFRKMVPPLIAEDSAEILHCSVLDHELGTLETNYRGPVVPFHRLGIAEPLGGDKLGNHGEEYGGNVLYKDGSIQEWERDHPRWKECATKLTPSGPRND
jgi:hypothetical protein